MNIGGTINTTAGTSYLGSSTGGVNTTLNITGNSASINQAINGNTGKGNINIQGNFSSQDIIQNFDNLNVQNSGTTFTNNAAIFSVDNITIDDGAIFDMQDNISLGTGNFTVNGTLDLNIGTSLLKTGIIGSTGVINVKSNRVEFDNGLTINSGGVLNIDGGSILGVLGQNIVNNGEIKITDFGGDKEGGLNNVGTLSGNGAITFKIYSDKTNDFINLNSGTANLNNTTFSVIVDNNAKINNGDSFDVITNLGGGSSIAANPTINLTSNNSKLTMKALLDSNTLKFLASVAANEITVNSPTFSNIISTLNSIAANNSNDIVLDSFVTNLAKLSSENLEDVIIEQIFPDRNNSSNQATFGTGQVATSLVVDRISAKSYNSRYAYNSGEIENENYEFWSSLFSQIGRQDKYKKVSGYNLRSTGLMIGGDYKITNKNAFGLAAGIFGTSINSRYKTKNKTRVKSIQFIMYDSYNFGSFYLDGIASVGRNSFEKFRRYNVEGFNKESFANYKGMQYSLNLETGLSYSVTPLLSLQFSRITQSEYKEQTPKAESLSQTISYKDNHLLNAGIGIKFRTKLPSIELDESELMFSGNVRYSYDFIADESEAVIRYQDGAPFEAMGPRPSRHVLSGSIDIKATDDNVSVNYLLGASLKEKFYSLSTSVQIRYSW